MRRGCSASAGGGPWLAVAHPALFERKVTTLDRSSRSGFAIQAKKEKISVLSCWNVVASMQ
jgi:hypothetical protein